MARLRTAAGESLLALQIRLMSWLRLVWRKWKRAAADLAAGPPRRDRNGGLLTFREFASQPPTRCWPRTGALSPQVLRLKIEVYDPGVHYQQVRDA
jgi:hypothetical protein